MKFLLGFRMDRSFSSPSTASREERINCVVKAPSKLCWLLPHTIASVDLALPTHVTDAGSPPRYHCLPSRTEDEGNDYELEKVSGPKSENQLATRFFRPSVA
jgi:hypothetical protein